MKACLCVFFFILLVNFSLLSSSQVEIPEWLLLDVSIQGELQINHDNMLVLTLKCVAADLKNCIIEPIADDKAVYFYPLATNKLDFAQNKAYQLSLKFRVLDKLDNKRIGIKFTTVYPVESIISLLKERYPQDSITRAEKIEYLMSRNGKVAEFIKQLDIYMDEDYSYTSITGVPPFYVKTVGKNAYFTVCPSSDYEVSKESLVAIDKEVKDKLGYCELLKDPAIKDSLSDDPVQERRSILKRIYELKFAKILLHHQMGEPLVMEEFEKFITDFEKTRIVDRHFWREIVCFYLFQKCLNNSLNINPVIKSFLELKVKDWNLSFVYYNYAVYLSEVEKKPEQAVEFINLAIELNPYMHIARKLSATFK